METIGFRLKKYLEYKKVSRIIFCDCIGIKYNSLSRIINSGSAMNSDTLERVFNYFPELNTRWFMTGNGPMEYEINSYYLDPVLEKNNSMSIESIDDFLAISDKELEELMDSFFEEHKIRDKFMNMMKEYIEVNIINTKK